MISAYWLILAFITGTFFGVFLMCVVIGNRDDRK